MTAPDDSWTLRQSRDWLRERAEEGQDCPCCHQMAKVYRRKLTASIGAVLIKMYRAMPDGGWIYLPAIRSKGQDEVIARFWGLIERDPDVEKREDGSRRVGWWRLTPLGIRFVANMAKVPKYARIYNNRLLNFDTSEAVSIIDVLGTRFSYDDLMAGM